MSELKKYVNEVSWTESVSQHKEAILFIHERQKQNLERQLDQKREVIESFDIELDNARKDKYKAEIKARVLERQIKEAKEDVESYKYDLETLVSVVSDCLNKMSGEECYDTLQQVANHYDELKEQG